MQAYGLTETTSSAMSQLPNQTDTNTVGSVIPCSEIRLVDWTEAGYRNTDKPNPRGEIYIGGNNVALGYYKQPELTEAEFKTINGVRYFASGDIGEMFPNGTLKIIDRKKDLVKLSGGEYVSLNKVESILKLIPFIDNCCVYADPLKSYCICIVCPNSFSEKIINLMAEDDDFKLKEINEYLSMQNTIMYRTSEMAKMLAQNPRALNRLEKDLAEHCMTKGIERFEIPLKAIFVKEIWTPDTGLVTDSLKLKRKAIEVFYESKIKAVYV